MRKREQEDETVTRRVSALAVAWLLLLALLGGITAWLYLQGAPETGVTVVSQRIEAPIPPPAAAAETAAIPAPETTAAEPAPPTQAPPIGVQPPAEAPPEEKPKETAEAPAPSPPVPSEAAAPQPHEAATAAPAPPSPPAPSEAQPSEPAAPKPAPESEAKQITPEEAAGAHPAEAAPETPAPPHAAEAEKPAAPPPAKEAAKEPAKEMAEEPAKEAAKEPTKETAKETAKESAPPPAEKPAAPPAPAAVQAAEGGKAAPESEIAALPAPLPPEVKVPEVRPPEAKPPAGPDPALLERGREGMLPTIAPDGRQPWKYYARPFDDRDKRPRIAVVVSDLGLSSAATETAIQQLPGSITLAFSPYAKNLDEWTRLARLAGHEVFLNLPMEPVDYPEQDPGPYALLTSIDPKQNLFRMDWLLSRAAGYAGVTNHMGSRFTISGEDLRPVLDVLKARGLMFLDSRSSDQSIAAKMAKDLGMPMAYNNRFLDAEASRDAIDKNLSEIERIARRTGYAVAMGSAYPVTIERISNWLPKAEAKGFVIAPVTALADKQEVK